MFEISETPFDMDGIKFSLVMKTPEYHCDVDVFTDANILNVFRPDPDGDGVFDWDDLDDGTVMTCADTGCGYWLNYGYTCDQLSNNYGYDCSLCEEEGACGGDEPECGSYDCAGPCADGYESWQGDGYCDDGAWGIDFMCEEWNFDNGDCDGRSASSSKANIL